MELTQVVTDLERPLAMVLSPTFSDVGKHAPLQMPDAFSELCREKLQSKAEKEGLEQSKDLFLKGRKRNRVGLPSFCLDMRVSFPLSHQGSLWGLPEYVSTA